MNYFSNDGGYKKPRTTECFHCIEGKDDDGNTCAVCHGSCELELSPEEEQEDVESCKDREADTYEA